MPEQKSLLIAYDGECPFCSAYVRMVRLRDSVGEVELINAREPHPFVAEVRTLGFDINSGMAAKYGGKLYFGADVMHLLSVLSGPSGFLNRLIARVFRHEKLASALYPILVVGRNFTLWLLRRKAIQNS